MSHFPETFKRRYSDPWLRWFSWAKYSVGVFTRDDIQSTIHWQLSLSCHYYAKILAVFLIRITLSDFKITQAIHPSTRHLSRPASSITIASACRVSQPLTEHTSVTWWGRCTRRLYYPIRSRNPIFPFSLYGIVWTKPEDFFFPFPRLGRLNLRAVGAMLDSVQSFLWNHVAIVSYIKLIGTQSSGPSQSGLAPRYIQRKKPDCYLSVLLIRDRITI